MRSGGCSIQQSLTPETAVIVKQAINLARRRGHAQVTPIHVASIMLASPAGLLRTACLKSHSHPLQTKALELCFNVALNRLPTISPAPILGPHSHYPALANALMAAFKRAQAHQRRGSIESQQQLILALKIEIEQLVVSILDDPSVSRVMREAGFSSPHVKSNVEHAVSPQEGCSQQITNTTTTCRNLKPDIVSPIITRSAPNFHPQIPSFNQFDLAFTKPLKQYKSEDVSSVINSWMKRKEKGSFVLVGECLGSCEGVVRGVKERFERGDVNLEMRHVQFLNCPLLQMKNLSKEEIDLKLGEIRCLLKGCLGRGVVLYLGDLRWAAEYWSYYGEQRKYYYCPVEHLVMGLTRLVFGNVEFGRLWLMGIATFNTYMKCKSGNPSLENLLDLHPLTIPAGSLDLTLNFDWSCQEQNKNSFSGDGSNNRTVLENKMNVELTCCSDCSGSCREEARSIRNIESNTSTPTSSSSSLPSWLLKCKQESRETSPTNQEETVQIKELCKKWNSICSSLHKTPNFTEKTTNFSSCSHSPSTSVSSYDYNHLQTHETKPKWASKEHQFLFSSSRKDFFENEAKPELLSNPNSTPNSTSSSEATEAIFEGTKLNFKDYNPENLEAMSTALEKKVPWQKDIIPEVATTILRIRSGMMTRKCKLIYKDQQLPKHEAWLFFLGMDDEGKHKLARELAKLIFGSSNRFKSIGLSSFSSTRADSTEDFRNKRVRDESGRGYLERFADAVRENPHRVFYVEDVEQVDHCSQKGIKRAIETGQISLCDGSTVNLDDAIIIFSCDTFSSTSRACSPPVKQKVESNKFDKDDFGDCYSSGALDLNIAVDDDSEIEQSVGDIRVLESVDKQLCFKVQML